MLDDWIIGIRNDFLTDFFKIIIHLSNDYLYITIMAFGYWMRPRNYLFTSLAFICPSASIMSFLFKNIFQIPRPDLDLHLVLTQDPFSFPSSHVLVATVFWGTIFLHSSRFRFLYFIPIFLIALARVYAGVHSTLDVGWGVLIGALIAYSYYMRPLNPIHQKISIVFLCMLYAIVSIDLMWPKTVLASMGILLGYGLSTYWIDRSPLNKNQNFSLLFVFYFSLAIVLLKSLSFIEFPYKNLASVIKYAIFMMFIFITIPALVKKE